MPFEAPTAALEEQELDRPEDRGQLLHGPGTQDADDDGTVDANNEGTPEDDEPQLWEGLTFCLDSVVGEVSTTVLNILSESHICLTHRNARSVWNGWLIMVAEL